MKMAGAVAKNAAQDFGARNADGRIAGRQNSEFWAENGALMKNAAAGPVMAGYFAPIFGTLVEIFEGRPDLWHEIGRRTNEGRANFCFWPTRGAFQKK